MHSPTVKGRYSRTCLERLPHWPQTIVSQDRWSLVTHAFTLKSRTFCQKLVVLRDRWSLMAVVSQDRFHCILSIPLYTHGTRNYYLILVHVLHITVHILYMHQLYFLLETCERLYLCKASYMSYNCTLRILRWRWLFVYLWMLQAMSLDVHAPH